MRSTDYLHNTEQQVIPLIKFSFPDDRVIFQDVNVRTPIVNGGGKKRSKLKVAIQNISVTFFLVVTIFFG